MNADQKFIFICIKCTKEKRVGAVNHEYMIIKDAQTNQDTGIKLTYHCFTCGERETKTVIIGRDTRPTDKWDFIKKIKGKTIKFGKVREN